MASRVNTKFVVLLAAGAIVVCAALGGAYVYFGPKSSAANVKLGDQAAAAQDWDKAVRFYANAANKEKTNTAVLEKWIDALAHTSPKTQQAYTERYNAEYMTALKQLATVRRTDAAAHARYLGLQLEDFRRFGSDSAVWNEYLKRVEDSLRIMPESSKDREKLRRFRGIARITMFATFGIQLKPTEIKEAIEDLNAALAVDPKDQDAVTALASYYAWQARVDGVKGNEVGVRENRAKSIKLLEDFIAANPGAVTPITLLAQTRMGIARDEDLGRTPPRQLAVTMQAEGKKPYDAVMAADMKALRPRDIVEAIGTYLSTFPTDMQEVAEKAYAAALEARPGEPELLLERAQSAVVMQNYALAEKYFGELAAAPDRPLSSTGALLFTLRPLALTWQANAALEQFSAAKDPEEKAKHLARAEGYRNEFAKKTTAADPQLTLLNAKLAGAAGDTTKMRQLLTDYNEAMGRKDVQGLFMLAQVLAQQGNLGGAKQQVARIIEINKATVPVWRLSMQIEMAQGNYTGALTALDRLLATDPQNPELLRAQKQIQNIVDGIRSEDPWIRDYAKLIDMSMQIAPDLEQMKALTLDLTARTEDAGRLMQMAQRLASMGERDKAIEALDRAIAKAPTNAQAKTMRETLASADPLKSAMESIETGPGSEGQKWLQKAAIYEQLGKHQEASDAFAKAKGLEPDNPAITQVLFENAIATQNVAEAKALADKAEQKNFDKMEGKTFRIRALILEGKVPEAERLAVTLTERDKLNPMVWKLMGDAQMAGGALEQARNSYTRSLQIKASDPRTVMALLRSMAGLGQGAEALREARERTRTVGSDPDFSSMLLDLEFDYGDKDAALLRRQRIFDAAPDNLNNTAKLAEWLVRQRKTAEAERPLAKLREVKAGSVEVLEAASALAKNDTKTALEKLDEFVARNPEMSKEGGGHIVFARGLNALGFGGFMADVLEKGRSIQNPDTMDVDREIGDLAFNSGKYDKAIEAYKRVLATLKDDKEQLTQKRLAEAQLRAGKFQDALESISVVKATGDSAYQFHLLTADAYAGLNQPAKARAALDAAVKASPALPLPLYKRAQYNLGEERYAKDAETDLQEVLRMSPRFFAARQLLGEHYAKAGDTDKMLMLMREGIKIDPANDESRALLIRAYSKLGKYEQANALAREAIDESKNDPRWVGLAANLFREQNDFKRELELESQLWQARKIPAVGARYADTLLKSTPPDIAAARAVLMSPEAKTDELGPLLLLRARMHTLDNRPLEAEKDANAAMTKAFLDQVGDSGRFVDDLDVALGGPDQALAFLNANVAEAKRPEALRFQMARLGAKGADAQKGLAQLEALTNSSDGQVKLGALTTLGDIYANKKDFEKSVQFYQRVLAITPEDTKMMNNVAFILAKYLGRASEALPFAEKAFAANKDDANFADTLGTVQLELKDYARAEQSFQRARGVAVDALERTPPTLHLAELKLANNDKKGAVSLVEDVWRWMKDDRRIGLVHKKEIESMEDRLGLSRPGGR
ncbi:hypothetical protein BH11PLA1_BH11PLA1_20490 [soil metagenome]